MTTLPNKIRIELSPHSREANRRRSRAEEIRRQGAIIEHVFREAQNLGIDVHATGEIDPAARLNPERADRIKNETLPKLISFSHKAGPTIEAVEIRTPDGAVYKGLKARQSAVTKLSVDLTDLTRLGHRLVDLIADTQTAVVKIGARILTAIGVPAGGEENDPESSSSSSGE